MSLHVARHVSPVAADDGADVVESLVQPVFRWRDGSTGLTFQADGVAWEFAGERPAPTPQLLRSVRVEQSADNPELEAILDGLPMALHARRFDLRTASASTSAWDDWPGACTWLPARILLRLPDGRRFRIAQAAWEPGGTRIDVRERARAWSARLARKAHTASASLPPASGTSTSLDERAREAFVSRVERARAAIRSGGLSKVVLARSETIDAPAPFDPHAQFVALAESATHAIAFAWDRGPAGCWVGATPEVLLRCVKGRLRTSAIAGTALAADDPTGAGLLSDPKIREEHGLVVEAMTEALRAHVRGLDVAPGPRVIRSERLVHLETPMEGELVDGDGLAACASLHPTPALGGRPRDAALDWLAANEALDRGYFGAPIGWLAPNGDGVLAVGIRAALVRGTRATLFAGAGIVRDSNPDAEWTETEHKLQLARTTLRVETAPTEAPSALPRPRSAVHEEVR